MLANPVPAADFMAVLRVRSAVFDLSENGVGAGVLQRGDVLKASRGARLWKADITLTPGYHRTQAGVEALLSYIRDVGVSFLAYDTRYLNPASDLTGAGIAGAQIADVLDAGRELVIKGLANGYVMTTGDMMGFTYGTSPVRRALHRVIVGGVVSGGEVAVQVTPPIRAGWAADTAINLGRPVARMKYLDGTFRPGVAGGRITDGGSFSAIQILGD